MVYSKRKNIRIQDPDQINYVKSILEASVQQCQQGGMYAPEIYIATAQRIADTYSLQDSNYPRITFNSKEQKLKGQQNPVPELTASIGDRTSTSYFLIKDSLPQGTKASPEQLTHLRPDIVSARIAANLGIVQPPPVTTSATIPPIDRGVPSPVPVQTVTVPTQAMPGAIPTSHATTMSKAQAMAQTVAPETPQPLNPTPINSAVAGLAALATPSQANTQNPPAFIEENNFALNNSSNAPIAERIPNANVTAPPLSPVPQPDPIHNPRIAKAIKTTNQNLQTAGNLNQNIGKALKDMAKGEVNPIQLYGDTLNIIGSFINGIPAGIQEARLKSIAQQMKLIEDKKRAIDLKMDRVGNDFIASEHKPPVTNTDVFNTSVPKPETKFKDTVPAPTSPSIPAPSKPGSANRAIDKLLKSNASLDEKLDAIEKTLDKMLEELIKIEKNLETIQASIQSEAQATNPTSIPNPEDMVIETEAKTEVEVVANNPMAEVPIKTEIDTDIVAEAKTETEAAEEIEVPETTVDSAPDYDIDREMVDLISSYEGDLDQLNDRLKVHKLQINLSEDRQRLSVSEIDNGMACSVFEAQADSEGWKVSSQINDSVKLDILERFVEAEGAVLTNFVNQPGQTPESKKAKKEEPSLFL
ncbi:MAG: hypothetical protein QNJ72_05030 [Pleurocapsa sp. MO_226.B13]|nr:hypothetical protein [Pleurocapsa sp. MO_226.B13]